MMNYHLYYDEEQAETEIHAHSQVIGEMGETASYEMKIYRIDQKKNKHKTRTNSHKNLLHASQFRL